MLFLYGFIKLDYLYLEKINLYYKVKLYVLLAYRYKKGARGNVNQRRYHCTVLPKIPRPESSRETGLFYLTRPSISNVFPKKITDFLTVYSLLR